MTSSESKAAASTEMVNVLVDKAPSDGTAGAPKPVIVPANHAMARLASYTKPYRARIFMASFWSVLNKVLDLMPPIMVSWVIDTINQKPPGFVKAASGETPIGYGIVLAAIVMLVFGFESLFQWAYTSQFMRIAQDLQHDLRRDVYAQLQRQEHAFFENHRVGDVMTMLNDDINSLERFLNTGFNTLLQLVVLFCFSVTTLVATSWHLALVGLWPLPLVAYCGIWYHRKIAPRYLAVRRTVADVASRLENNIGGMAVVKAFNAEAFEEDRVREASLAYKKANYEAIRLATVYVPIIRMVVALGFGGVVLLGSYWVLEDGEDAPITVGQLVLYSMLIQRVLWPLTRLGPVLDDYERAASAASRTFGLLDRQPSIQDPPAHLTRHLPPLSPGVAAGAVSFRDVRFGYPGTRDAVLKGLDFEVRSGQLVGVCGTTGAGKSTIIKLLLRLYDTSSGTVELDGVNVRSLPLQELRQRVSLVSQDVFLFAGTIRDNIAYGLECVEDASPRKGEAGVVSHSDVEEASKVAQLYDFVCSLPAGFDTVVGERGVKLSGGQRQRLSIARAVLKNAPCMIFDEATSAVDTETERLIQESLTTFTRGRTAIVVAHRLSTIRHADNIVVLSNGIVSEQGTFEQLLATNGTFAELWRLQSGTSVPPQAEEGGQTGV